MAAGTDDSIASSSIVKDLHTHLHTTLKRTQIGHYTIGTQMLGCVRERPRQEEPMSVDHIRHAAAAPRRLTPIPLSCCASSGSAHLTTVRKSHRVAHDAGDESRDRRARDVIAQNRFRHPAPAPAPAPRPHAVGVLCPAAHLPCARRKFKIALFAGFRRTGLGSGLGSGLRLGFFEIRLSEPVQPRLPGSQVRHLSCSTQQLDSWEPCPWLASLELGSQ